MVAVKGLLMLAPIALLSCRVKVSSGSKMLSGVIGTRIVWGVVLPAAKVN
jgi:hypothetical protein